MNGEHENIFKICLDGDWSMSGISEKLPTLATYLAGLVDCDVQGDNTKNPGLRVPEIDLAGVTDFDACGCQLLALFVSSLRQNGIRTQLTNMSDSFRSKVHFLGFDRELDFPL